MALEGPLGRAGLDVAGQVGAAAALLVLVGEHRPDLAIVDIRMPPGYRTEGLDAARQIREQFPSTGILLPSAHGDWPAAARAFLCAGWCGTA